MLIRKLTTAFRIKATQPEMVALRSMGQLQNPDPIMRSGTLAGREALRGSRLSMLPAAAERNSQSRCQSRIRRPSPRQFDAVLKTELA